MAAKRCSLALVRDVATVDVRRLLPGAACAALLLAAAMFGPGSAAAIAGPSMPPHIKGSTYCETINKPAIYVLYGYVKGVSCATEKAFVSRCQIEAGLHGWKLHTNAQDGVILRKGTGTLDLQLTGSSPLCISVALS